MTFEERIARLTERHEALAQTVELIAIQQQKNEELQRKNEELQRKNEVLIARVIESIHDLARVAEAHERRISGLERGGG